MSADDVGLDLRLTEQRCTEQGGGIGGMLAMLQGGATGACGSRKARITLTPGAIAALRRAGQTEPAAIVLCCNPKCGKAISDMNGLRVLLGLLR